MVVLDSIFGLCVILLDWFAAGLGVSYVAVNVWIFCVIWPALTLWLVWYIFKLRNKLKEYDQRKSNSGQR